eukprot:403343926
MELPKELKDKARGRQEYKFQDRVIYEWEQTLDEVHIYIQPPRFLIPKYKDEFKKQLQPGEKLPELEVKFTANHIAVGIKGNPPFMNEDLGGQIKSSESYWMIEDDELHIQLQKMYKAETWSCACKGHAQLDPLTQNEVQKGILLERFQEENPGFDFSGAEVNGMVPDPRNFMGGVKYT